MKVYAEDYETKAKLGNMNRFAVAEEETSRRESY